MSTFGLLLSLLYPAAIFFGSRHMPPAQLALLLLPLLFLRGAHMPGRWLVIASVLALGAATVLLRTHEPLKLYPVVMNLALLGLFGVSLLRPPSVVERIARLRDPALPPAAIVYTRRVTQAWCLFFVLNGALAFASAWYGSDEVWFWYNGVIAYVLIGAMFAGEWLLRRRVMRKSRL